MDGVFLDLSFVDDVSYVQNASLPVHLVVAHVPFVLRPIQVKYLAPSVLHPELVLSVVGVPAFLIEVRAHLGEVEVFAFRLVILELTQHVDQLDCLGRPLDLDHEHLLFCLGTVRHVHLAQVLVFLVHHPHSIHVRSTHLVHVLLVNVLFPHFEFLLFRL